MGSRALQGPRQAAPLGSSPVLQPVCTRLWPAASALSGGEQQVSLMQVEPLVQCWSAVLHLKPFQFASLRQHYLPRSLTHSMLSPAQQGSIAMSNSKMVIAGLAPRASLASVQGLRSTASLHLSVFACQ